ncbi:type II toxin-antitoxin system HicB family antitoxin [Lactobacillus xujianguonis]|uniref:Type II toxin-antitoxin system HicB family antitoxin n=1 Tax=Lactobacillus xujianguonis TaxID=2495899 RepID=A0A437SU20_9LACO|nr:type II toxin-antitoxin system HicB family antitoxin [Lactobacillus xujianguonis]RVU70415.1 type II toxin-antitoxin system HicB family antitoxin [Lactobacillus xujianguonis]
MSVVVYPAILDDSENEKGYYTVTFPDVEGAITDGRGEGKAMANGSEVLGALLYDVPKDQLPVPTDIESIRKNNPDKLVVPIFADLEKAKLETKPATVKKNTTIPGDLAYKAEQAGINFSKTLTEALQHKLA